MDKKTEDFLLYFEQINDAKKELLDLLSGKQSTAYAYYLAPIDNIINIYRTGGIQPRNKLTGFADVSSSPVQELREKKLSFYRCKQSTTVNLHDCVNLFLNPINDTFYQFRRNALLRSSAGTKFCPIIGIIEIDLRKLLSQPHIYWDIYPVNVVKPTSIYPVEYWLYPWEKIYHLTRKKNHFYYQAAEILIHNPTDNTTIENSVIKRVLFYESDIHAGFEGSLSKIGFEYNIINNHSEYSAINDPLDADRKFINNLYELTNHGKSIYSVIYALEGIHKIEEKIRLSLYSSYLSDSVGKDNKHGISHTLRVLFWVFFLASETIKKKSESITEDDIKTAAFAAFIHDLGRENNRVDPNHGSKSAALYKNHMEQVLDAPYLQKCLRAVEIHSIENDPEKKDFVWILLKDADSIERCRFAPPENDKGCKKEYLRLKILTEDADYSSRLLWTAYYFARVTKYINWTGSACNDFLEIITSSLLALESCTTTPKYLRDFSRRLIDKAPII